MHPYPIYSCFVVRSRVGAGFFVKASAVNVLNVMVLAVGKPDIIRIMTTLPLS